MLHLAERPGLPWCLRPSGRQLERSAIPASIRPSALPR